MMHLPFKLDIDCIIAWIPAKPATLPLLPLSKPPSSTDACSCIIVTKNERNESNQVGLLSQMHIYNINRDNILYRGYHKAHW